MELDESDRRMAARMDRERMFDLLDNLKAAAHALLADMRLSPGGDEYVYGGSTSHVDWLRETAAAWEGYQMEMDDGSYDEEP